MLGLLELVWSFMVDYENNDNPFDEAIIQISRWQSLAVVDCDITDEVGVNVIDPVDFVRSSTYEE